jgi:hypothetical protein
MELPIMTTGVSEILTRIATLERLITSPETTRAVKCYDQIPYTLSSAQCPAFINFPKGLIENRLVGSEDAEREFWEIRNYSLVLYHSSYGKGANEEKSGLLVPYFELVYDLFGRYPHLDSMSGVIDAQITTDSGVGISTYVGNQFFAVSFNLRVTTQVRRLLASAD